MRLVKCALFGCILLEAACATEMSTATSALGEATSLDNPVQPRDNAPAPAQRLTQQARVPGAGITGYYDMFFESGQGYEVAPILAAGGTPVLVDDPSAAALADLNVLFVTNPDNGSFGFEYPSRLADIAAAVNSGMVLVIHDREVSDAAGILPSGGSFGIIRETFNGVDINIRDASTTVTAGLNDTSLDGGNLSDHGFAQAGTLPTRAKLILSRTSSDEIVTFCYPVGRGAVIYSTIPLDFYLIGAGTNPPASSMVNIYAPNVVKYAIAGACGTRGGPRPTPNFND